LLEVSELLVGDNFFFGYRVLLLARQGVMSPIPEHYLKENFGRIVYEGYPVGYDVEVDHSSKVYCGQPRNWF